MTQTTTDYLYQLNGPATDRTYSAPSSNDSAGTFDDHLSQASTLAGDDSRSNGGNSLRADSGHFDRDGKSWNSTDPKPTSHKKENSTPATTSRPEEDKSDNSASSTRPSTDNADDDQHNTDKSQDTTAAAAAGATQSTHDNSQKADSKSTPNENGESAAATRIDSLTDEATPKNGNTGANHADQKATNDASLSDLAAQHVDQAAKLATAVATEPAVAADRTVQSQVAEVESKQSKGDKSDATKSKAKTDADATNVVAAADKSSSNVAADGEVSASTTQQAADHPQGISVAANPTAAKNALESDKSTDDESHHGTRDDAGAGTLSDVAAQANKVDAAQLVNGAIIATDADANAPVKTKSSDQTTKPIGTASETPAAAFARLTRASNGAGDSSSATGANDAPQIDPSRFVGRVAKAFQTAQDRGGTLQLRLSPPELGRSTSS